MAVPRCRRVGCRSPQRSPLQCLPFTSRSSLPCSLFPSLSNNQPSRITPQTEDILNAILPPREWTDEGKLWVQYVSPTPATRLDVINTQETLDQRLLARQVQTHARTPCTPCYGPYRPYLRAAEMLQPNLRCRMPLPPRRRVRLASAP